MKILGHRGAAGLILENTVASVEKALEFNVDGIEFDVRATKDDQAVIIHDETLERTHKITAKVADLTLAQVQELTQDHHFPVPSLSQILRAIGTRVPANVELKELAAVAPTLRTLNELAESGVIHSERILITSFDHSAVALLRKHTNRYTLGLLTDKAPSDSYWKLADSLDVAAVNISKDAVNKAFVEKAHADGREVMVYTVNDKGTADELSAMGVDAIFTDVPDQFVNGKRSP